MKYEEAISTIKQALRQLATNGVPVGNMIEAIKDIEEKYAESEDERIRKWIIAYLENRVMNTSITDEKDNCSDAIRWLKKQGEQSPAVDTKIIIPKFRVGDIVKSKSQPMLSPRKIISIDKDCYWCEDRGCIGFAWEDDCEIVEQKPTWSEKDETGLTNTIIMLKEGASLHFNKNDIAKSVDWLKSIKDRVQPKQEWSEEDDEHLERILKELGNQRQRPINSPYLDKIESDYNWLKSLKPQNKWKPSDEQMEALLYEVNAWDEDSVNGQNLKSLYQDLKKLMEE